MSEKIGEVTGINFYPIKSCQAATVDGELPQQLQVGLTGFMAHGVVDRGFVVTDPDGLFVSRRGWDREQRRKHPGDSSALAQVAIDVQYDHLAVSSPVGELQLDTMNRPSAPASAEIFGADYNGVDCGPEAGDYFSRLLGREVILVGYGEPRPIKNTDYHEPDSYNVAAASDGFPFLLVNQGSLDQAHEASGVPLGTQPLAAYRGNIEMAGEPWIEDRVSEVSIGDGFRAHVSKACSRCPIPDQDVETGLNTGNSRAVLSGIRRGWKINDDPLTDPAQIYFGQNLNHTMDSFGAIIAVNDVVMAPAPGRSNFVPKNQAI